MAACTPVLSPACDFVATLPYLYPRRRTCPDVWRQPESAGNHARPGAALADTARLPAQPVLGRTAMDRVSGLRGAQLQHVADAAGFPDILALLAPDPIESLERSSKLIMRGGSLLRMV